MYGNTYMSKYVGRYWSKIQEILCFCLVLKPTYIPSSFMGAVHLGKQRQCQGHIENEQKIGDVDVKKN